MKRILIFLLALLACGSAWAATTQVSPDPKLHFVDSSGNACSGCKLFTYSAGTTTKLNTFTDQTGNTQNANPVILDTRGEANVWLAPATLYKFVLAPSTDSDPPTNAFYTVDNLSAGIIVPVIPSQGGTSVWFGGATTGTGNAQVLATVTPPTGFTLTSGYRVTFIAGATNSGATTLNVFSTGATAVKKRTTAGLVALAGNEIIANAAYTVEYDGTQYQLLDPSNLVTGPASSTAGTVVVFADATGQALKAGTLPTQTRKTSGSAQTYTTPAGVSYLRVRMIGGGGGGGGGGSGGGNGVAGTASTFTDGTLTLSAGGGGLGGGGNGGSPGAGGTSTGGDINIAGGDGSPGGSGNGGAITTVGGSGGSGGFGGAGAGGANSTGAGGSGKTNSGGGGGGGGAAAGTIGGGGGGSGGYLEKLIMSPSASYTYTVGGGGANGAAGTSSGAGAAGAAGLIIIDEFYQ